jgi:hypothetical protein
MKIGEPYMTLSRSYTAELELLITDTLLPIFDKYYRDHGELPKYTGINPSLLKQIKKCKAVPALFLPKKKSDLQSAA